MSCRRQRASCSSGLGSRAVSPNEVWDPELRQAGLSSERVQMNLRVASWNRGMAYHEKIDKMMLLRPDLAVVAECAEPDILCKRAPLPEIIDVLNQRFGTHFSEEDRPFFQQIKEKACKSEQVIRTAMANPLDKFRARPAKSSRPS